MVFVRHGGSTPSWCNLYIIAGGGAVSVANSGTSGITATYSNGVTTFDISNMVGSSCYYKVLNL